MPLNTQMQHLGQKYMGVRPDNHIEAMFKGLVAQSNGNHPVPISNFMNAQCTYRSQKPSAHCVLFDD